MKHDALEKANESYKEFQDHIDRMQALADEQPVTITVKTVYTDNVVFHPSSF